MKTTINGSSSDFVMEYDTFDINLVTLTLNGKETRVDLNELISALFAFDEYRKREHEEGKYRS